MPATAALALAVLMAGFLSRPEAAENLRSCETDECENACGRVLLTEEMFFSRAVFVATKRGRISQDEPVEDNETTSQDDKPGEAEEECGDQEEAARKVALLRGARQVFHTDRAFALLEAKGSVFVWGGADQGGNDALVGDELRSGVQWISATRGAFAALKRDGSLVAWGDELWGGDTTKLLGGDTTEAEAMLASGVLNISATRYSFTATKANGQEVVWGWKEIRLKSGKFCAKFGRACATLGDDGSVRVSTDDINQGFHKVMGQLTSEVRRISATRDAFAALKASGRVVVWGAEGSRWDSSFVKHNLTKGVRQLRATFGAFAALKWDGSVVAWGDKFWGGDAAAAKAGLTGGVRGINSTFGAFVALRFDGAVLAWGDKFWGGDFRQYDGNLSWSRSVKDELTGRVHYVRGNNFSFEARKEDGLVVQWGWTQENPMMPRTVTTRDFLKSSCAFAHARRRVSGSHLATLSGFAAVAPHGLRDASF